MLSCCCASPAAKVVKAAKSKTVTQEDFHDLLHSLPVGEARDALNTKGWRDNLPIHIALRYKDPDAKMVKLMLDVGGNDMLSARACANRLPLHMAAWWGTRPDVVELLVRRGPFGAVRAKSNKGDTPLMKAELRPEGPGKAVIVAAMKKATIGELDATLALPEPEANDSLGAATDGYLSLRKAVSKMKPDPNHIRQLLEKADSEHWGQGKRSLIAMYREEPPKILPPARMP